MERTVAQFNISTSGDTNARSAGIDQKVTTGSNQVLPESVAVRRLRDYLGLIGMLVVLNVHVNPADQRNIDGQPILRTVYSQDPGLWLINVGLIAAIITVAVAELAARTRRVSEQPGLIAIVLGVLLCVYSLFGWLYGVAAIAPIGAMLILSGVPVSRTRTPSR